MENLYNILGVSPSATADEIKKAYRALAMRHHPDRNMHPGSAARFNAIKMAYELLADPKKRAEYNLSLNNRIVIDAQSEARALWNSLFIRCEIIIGHGSSHQG
ncbi:MAG: J domain-containing protein [Gallionella sp.]|nr:J domain-containing protein [Gallionella sp.]